MMGYDDYESPRDVEFFASRDVAQLSTGIIPNYDITAGDAMEGLEKLVAWSRNLLGTRPMTHTQRQNYTRAFVHAWVDRWFDGTAPRRPVSDPMDIERTFKRIEP